MTRDGNSYIYNEYRVVCSDSTVIFEECYYYELITISVTKL